MNKPFSYKKENHLKKKADIEAVYKLGKVLRSSFFRAYYLPSTISRIGISVSSRLGNAVFRNHEKRAVREVFRKIKNEFSMPCDIVIVLSKKPPDEDSKLSDLRRIFKCLKDLKPL